MIKLGTTIKWAEVDLVEMLCVVWIGCKGHWRFDADGEMPIIYIDFQRKFR
jgi:hypothetical protein